MEKQLTKSDISAEKESLMKTIEKYDLGVNAEDIFKSENQNVPSDKNSLLIQILLEIICRNTERDPQRKQALYRSIWKRFIQNRILDEQIIHIDALSDVRSKAASQFEKEITRINQNLNLGQISSLLPSVDQRLENEPFQDPEKYEREFKELTSVGKGGFGVVYKAEHKLDGIIYAIKKIIFRYKGDSDLAKVVREVRSFATVSHLNVVGYNQAWFEYVRPSKGILNDSLCSEKNSTCSSISKTQNTYFTEIESSSLIQSWENESSSFTTETISKPKYWDNSHDESDDFITFREDLSKGAFGSVSESSYIKQSTLSLNSQFSNTEENKLSDSDQTNISNRGKQKVSKKHSRRRALIPNLKVMLYIQMEYCDEILRSWLDERAKGNPLPFQLSVYEIFRDILNGVAHIHSKAIIHRDLKPQNIFFSAKNNAMKIGDFGLATLSDSVLESDLELAAYHSSNCGTVPYAAPEQRSKDKYNLKVDMYSLGIILIELLINAQTYMEFSAAISDLIRGIVPEKLTKNYPEYISLVRNLISEEPDARYSAKEALSMPPLSAAPGSHRKNSKVIKSLKKALAEKDLLINELRNQQAEKDKRIKELESLLNQRK